MIVQPDFLTHWKTVKFCNRLKEPHAPLYVLRLWSFCQTSRRDVVPADCESIAAICKYDGSPRTLIKALLDCEFIEKETGKFHKVHGWAELNAQLIHNWTVGVKGGRPKGVKNKPLENPRVNPIETLCEPIRLDKSRVDKIREEGEVSIHAPFNAEDAKKIPFAVALIKRHPAFEKAPVVALENLFKEYDFCRDHWPKIIRRFMTNYATIESPSELKHPPIQKLRWSIDDYCEKNKIGKYQG